MAKTLSDQNVKNLEDYFRERLVDSAESLQPPPSEDALWYTASMLARFGDSSQLFSYENGEYGLRPLAMLYKDAHETPDHLKRCLLLRQLGDLALFLGALFAGRYARRGIHRDYFIGMGGSAYDYLSENAQRGRHIFSELADTFARMLQLVASACSKQALFDSTDILKLYQRWQQTGDNRIAYQLQSLGIALSGPDIGH